MSHNVTRDQRMVGLNLITNQKRNRIQSRQRQLHRHRLRPTLLALEERTLLSMFAVTNNTVDDVNTSGTLRWAIAQANAATTSPSSIEIELGTTPATITLAGTQLELSNTAYPTTIYDGPGQGAVTVSGNNASRVFQIDNGVTASISGMTISGGNAYNGGGGAKRDGGGLRNYGTITLNDCTITGNTAKFNENTFYGGGGGGMANFGVATLTDCTLSGNSAPSSDEQVAGYAGGGAIFASGPMTTLTDCTLSGNSGEAIDADAPTTLTDCTLSGNSSSGGGGAIFNGATTLTLTDCTLSGNSTSIVFANGSAGGGAIDSNGGTTTLTDCTLSGNSSRHDGGAVMNAKGTTTLTDCTLSGNSAGSNGGGAIYSGFSSQSTTTLIDCTVSGNSTTGKGGGLYLKSGTMNVADSIVAGNTATGSGPDAFEKAGTSFTSQGNNLIGETDGSTGWVASDLQGTVATPLNALLALLRDYGGPTQTMALLPGSPAIGAGAAVSGVTTDQRGFPLDSPNPDIGAFQVQSSYSLVVQTTGDSGAPAGEFDLRGAIDMANILGSAETITFDPTVFAAPQTITLAGTQLELSDLTGTETITGPARGVTVSGGGLSRVFHIDNGVTASISGLTITGGSTTGYGGGLADYGSTLTLTDCTLSGNSAAAGGAAMYNRSSTLTLTDCTLSGNSAGSFGGGLNNRYGTITMTGCTVSGNSAGDGGGLNDSRDTATLTDCTLSNNHSTNGGGGVEDDHGTTTLTDCTVSGNSTSGNGGGLYNKGGSATSTTTLTNCTVSGNSAAGSGGGLFSYGGSANLALTDCTVGGNSAAGSGGGLYTDGQGTATVGDTIVATNTASTGPDVDGSFTSQGNNLIGETDGSTGWVASDLTGTVAMPLNPLLAALGNYGGPTQTMALLPGSPAIDAGNNALIPAGVTTDQRGFARIVNGTVDIGAFESLGFTITVTSGDGQSADVNTAFSAPLVVTVTANFPGPGGSKPTFGEPVAGGLVTFTAPATGASATIDGSPATIQVPLHSRIDNVGDASVTATANGIAGVYSVTASAAGAGTASFALTNTPGTPSSITIVSGSGQSTMVGQAFANPLVVRVEDAFGNVDPGVTVTFAAPAAGASTSPSVTTATTGSNGIASLTATADTTAGTYFVTVGVSGVVTTASFTLTNIASVTVPSGIYVLDPTGGGALTLAGSAGINVPGNVIVDSSSSSALTISGAASIKAGAIQVVGGVKKSGSPTFSPQPVTGITAVPDPLAALAMPAIPGGTTNGPKSIGGSTTTTLQPGIYSQISISGAAKVTLAAGTYVIQGGGLTVSGSATVSIGTGTSIILEGGGLSVSGAAAVSGTNVTVFNFGTAYNGTTDGGSFGPITLSGSGAVNLTAPTTGTYAGILIFQGRDNAKPLTFSGAAMQGVSGMIYAPAAQLVESGSASVGSTKNPISFIVDTMSLSGAAIADGLNLTAPAGSVAYTPAQIRAAYGISSLSLDGTGQTIAIVDAYDDPAIFQSLDAFDTQFGLTSAGPSLYDQYGPASSFLTVLNQSGQATSLPGTDPSGAGTDNWEVEEALDVEWAHAMAPGAQIILVEANSQSLSDLMASVSTAASQHGVSVVSMSWGFAEGQAVFAADEAMYDSYFNVPGVTFVASTGDYGAADPEYPAYSPNVVSVGGTSLTVNGDNSYNSETGWGYNSASVGAFIGSGGGISQYEPEPAYQQAVQSTGSRTTPDVSLVADPATGAWIADPYNLDPSNPFEIVGGTSLSAPAWAGLLALVNQGSAAAGGSALDSASPTETQQALYSLPQNDFNVIGSGTNGYTAGAGYNLVTGLGTPVANLLVTDLVAYQSGTFVASGPTVGALQNATLTDTGSSGSGTTNVFSVFDALTGERGVLTPWFPAPSLSTGQGADAPRSPGSSLSTGQGADAPRSPGPAPTAGASLGITPIGEAISPGAHETITKRLGSVLRRAPARFAISPVLRGPSRSPAPSGVSRTSPTSSLSILGLGADAIEESSSAIHRSARDHRA